MLLAPAKAHSDPCYSARILLALFMTLSMSASACAAGMVEKHFLNPTRESKQQLSQLARKILDKACKAFADTLSQSKE